MVVFFAMATLSSASDNDALLNLLVKKGLITSQEAEEVKTEMKQQTLDDLLTQMEQEYRLRQKSQPPTVLTSRPIQSLTLGGKLELRYEDSQGEHAAMEIKEFCNLE